MKMYKLERKIYNVFNLICIWIESRKVRWIDWYMKKLIYTGFLFKFTFLRQMLIMQTIPGPYLSIVLLQSTQIVH